MRVPEDNKPLRFWSRLSLKNWLSRPSSRYRIEFRPDVHDIQQIRSHIHNTNAENRDGMLEFGAEFDPRRHSCSSAANGALNSDELNQRYSTSSCQTHPSPNVMMSKDSENILKAKLTEKEQIRIFVGTWNVGGRPPVDNIDLERWLGSEEPADLYVIGFQEVVPLNAGNVLGAENNVPAARWLHLIKHTLNKDPYCTLKRSCSTSSSMWQESGLDAFKQAEDPLYYCKNRMASPITSSSAEVSSSMDFMDDTNGAFASPVLASPSRLGVSRSLKCRPTHSDSSQYFLVVSKQMVGIFLSIWVSKDLRRHVSNVKVSCVGCGLLGYLGNKGSISISMCVHQTTFCFICSHLTSGQKDRDEFRRNADVLEIMRRTHFNRRHSTKMAGFMSLPQTIMQHDRIIWLGDLNYRLALSPNDTLSLLVKENWKALLEKDQLHMQRKAGRVFVGWNEGQIYFAPTYKYRTNSDCYAWEKPTGEKRRTPAWCDRILWYGRGLKQLAYIRSEARFSDHRPVYAVFSAEVEVLSPRKLEDLLLRRIAEVDTDRPKH